MPLINYYKHNKQSIGLQNEDSPVYESHKFELLVDGFTEVENEFNLKRAVGITNSMPNIQYDTGWDISPVGGISKKVDEFTNNNLIRAFATTSQNFRPPLFTDGWTQKMAKSGSTLSVDLEFRSYPTDLYNTTRYQNFIKFLIFLTTPQEYHLINSLNVTGTALTKANHDGVNIGDRVSKMIEKLKGKDISLDIVNDKEVTDEIASIIKQVEELANMNDDKVGGAPLCTLSVGNTIYAHPSVKWLIKSWSFVPSINTTMSETGIEEPIYVDFKVSLETQKILTTEDLENIINYPGK